MLFGQNVVAQTTFYITPLINYKLLFCSYPSDQRFGNFYSEQTSFGNQNPYYTFEAKKVSTRPSINIGLRAGVSLKNKKHIIHFEWSQDEAGTMSKISSFQTPNLYGSNDIPSYNTYGHYIGYFQSGFAYNRLSLGYGIRLTNEQFPTSVYFMGDISIVYGGKNKATWSYEQDQTNTSIYYHNNAEWISDEINAYHLGVTSALIGIGIKTDIGLIVNQKKKYLFSMEINYKQGFKSIGSSTYTTLIDDNNETIGFVNELITRGSGIYFQVSRNIQLFPWRPNKKAHSNN